MIYFQNYSLMYILFCIYWDTVYYSSWIHRHNSCTIMTVVFTVDLLKLINSFLTILSRVLCKMLSLPSSGILRAPYTLS